jgi:hypothetical protein
MGPLEAVFAQPVPGLLMNLFSIKKLLLHSVIAEIAMIILKKLQSLRSFVPISSTKAFYFRFFFFSLLFLFLALKTEHNLGLLHCRYFINPNQKKQ